MEYYLIYVSTADHLMSGDELLQILEQSRAWNKAHGITGMLIYIEGQFVHKDSRPIYSETTGRFMQVLEGSKQEVERIFNGIQADTRHHSVVVLQESAELSPNFETWQMGFKSITADEFKASPGYFNIDQLLCGAADAELSNLPLHFLKSFYQRGKSGTTLFSSLEN